MSTLLAAGAAHPSMACIVADWARSVTMDVIAAVAGDVLYSIACMVAGWMHSVTMGAMVVATGAIVKRMTRMDRNRVVNCCSIR